jgi:hypothetical protein
VAPTTIEAFACWLMDKCERIYWHAPLILQNLQLSESQSILRIFRIIPSDVLAFSFDFTETPSPQRCYGEPSLSQRRALADSITSLRQLVKSKGAVQNIHT